MRRAGTPMLLKFGSLAAALSLAMVVTISLATPLHSEPEGAGGVEEIRPEPAAPERPDVVVKDPENTGRPNVRPEPAVPPELRNPEPEAPEVSSPPPTESTSPTESEKAVQREAGRQRAEHQKAQRQKAQRQKAERQEVERQKAERRKAERRKAERRKAERERAEQRKLRQQKVEREQRRIERQKTQAERRKAGKSSATRKVRTLPAGASGRKSEGQGRSEPVKSESGSGSPASRGGEMALSIKSIGLRNSKIETSDEQQALDRGLIHLPQTSRPWERGEARNVYVVGHRMGWPNTGSWKIFYRLDELQRNDRLVLTAGDETYRYEITEKFVVTPRDVWVTNPVKGRDLLTLQTCTGPDSSQRLIIRADRV